MLGGGGGAGPSWLQGRNGGGGDSGFTSRHMFSRLAQRTGKRAVEAQYSAFDFHAHFSAPTLRDGSVPSAAPQVADFERLRTDDTSM